MRWCEPLASICCILHWVCLKKTEYEVKNVPFPIRTRNLHRHHHGPWPRPCICCQRQKETARVRIRMCRLKSQRQGGKWSSHGRICNNIRTVVGVKEMKITYILNRSLASASDIMALDTTCASRLTKDPEFLQGVSLPSGNLRTRGSIL